jgi:hypothetical protein
MLYFREHQWMVVQNSSLFRADIKPETRKREDVYWSLEMNFQAYGPVWRRVRHWQRPGLQISVSRFKPQLKSWTDLEHLNFWEPETKENILSVDQSGFFDLTYYPRCGNDLPEDPCVGEFIWRVAARDGGWFTVELAGVAEGFSLLDLLAGEKMPVLPDGREERRDPDLAFWKKHAQIYAIENIPFGVVTVKVPHNVRDPEGYAFIRAKQLIGVNEPEHIVVTDFNKWEKCTGSLRDEVHVDLHFNGFYEM